MSRLLRAFILVVMLLALFGAGIIWMFRLELSYCRYRDIIAPLAAHNGIPPSLVAAVIWQESRFIPLCRGKAGELGLMQILPSTGREWAAAMHVSSFCDADLYNPRTNVMVGTWYLARALRRRQETGNPIPYALAEYNAGPSNARRWNRSAHGDPGRYIQSISYPATRRYVREILLLQRTFGKPWERWGARQPDAG